MEPLLDRTVDGVLLKLPKFKCSCRGVEYEKLRSDCYNYLREADPQKFRKFGSIFISSKSYGHDVEIRGDVTPLKFDACRVLFKALKKGKDVYNVSLHDENIIRSSTSTASSSATTEDEEIKVPEIFVPVKFEVLIAEAEKAVAEAIADGSIIEEVNRKSRKTLGLKIPSTTPLILPEKKA